MGTWLVVQLAYKMNIFHGPFKGKWVTLMEIRCLGSSGQAVHLNTDGVKGRSSGSSNYSHLRIYKNQTHTCVKYTAAVLHSWGRNFDLISLGISIPKPLVV